MQTRAGRVYWLHKRTRLAAKQPTEHSVDRLRRLPKLPRRRGDTVTYRLSTAELYELVELLAPLAAGRPDLLFLSPEDARRVYALIGLLLPPDQGGGRGGEETGPTGDS